VEICVGHSHAEEDLCVLLPEHSRLQMVEHANITQHLLDSFSRPGMEREMLDADLDMVEPIRRVSV
jgi:hypothetical protein